MNVVYVCVPYQLLLRISYSWYSFGHIQWKATVWWQLKSRIIFNRIYENLSTHLWKWLFSPIFFRLSKFCHNWLKVITHISNMSSESGPIWPLLDWLERVESMSVDRKDIYKNNPPSKFFNDLRDGIILSKVAMVACPSSANEFRNLICSGRNTILNR